jgi:hypothetical protein
MGAVPDVMHTCRVLEPDEAAGRIVIRLIPAMRGPLMLGGADGDGLIMVCGSCSRVLAERFRPRSVTSIVIRCACGTYNDADPPRGTGHGVSF